jgi:hypothetical protein
MTKRSSHPTPKSIYQQGAHALLAAICGFLQSNNISKDFISKSIQQHSVPKKSIGDARRYRELLRAYEEMGTVMSTWFSSPEFLDGEGRPVPLTRGRGLRSIASLIRLSHAKISAPVAVELMRRSPSVMFRTDGTFLALKRVFVLPEFEVPRAALVIERYLDTLKKNSSAQGTGTTLLLERNCHVPVIDLQRIAPILRDIKGRGTAFMDSVDGDIEAHRIHGSKRKGVGELGVLVFAWTGPSKIRTSKSDPKRHI